MSRILIKFYPRHAKIEDRSLVHYIVKRLHSLCDELRCMSGVDVHHVYTADRTVRRYGRYDWIISGEALHRVMFEMRNTAFGSLEARILFTVYRIEVKPIAIYLENRRSRNCYCTIAELGNDNTMFMIESKICMNGTVYVKSRLRKMLSTVKSLVERHFGDIYITRVEVL